MMMGSVGERLTFSEFVDFVLVRLAELGSESGELHDVHMIAAELREPVPAEWVSQATQALDERNLVTAALAFGNAASAIITGAGLLYVESQSHDTGLIEKYRERPESLVPRPSDDESPRYVNSASHAWALENRKFLELVFEAFEDEGNWPALYPMQRRLLRAGERTNIIQSTYDLPREFGYREAPPDERVVLTVFALRYVDAAAGILAHFMRVVRLAVDRYIETEESITIARSDLTVALGLSDRVAMRLGRILVRGTQFLSGGSTDIDSWELSVHEPGLFPFLDTVTIDELPRCRKQGLRVGARRTSGNRRR
jgi:hypothetical protein